MANLFDGELRTKSRCSVVQLEESRCPSMVSSQARIEKEHEITGTNVKLNMIPNEGTDLLFDIVYTKLLECVTTAKCKNWYFFEAIE